MKAAKMIMVISIITVFLKSAEHAKRTKIIQRESSKYTCISSLCVISLEWHYNGIFDSRALKDHVLNIIFMYSFFTTKNTVH